MFLRDSVSYSAVLDSPDVQRDAEVFASSPIEEIDASSEVCSVFWPTPSNEKSGLIDSLTRSSSLDYCIESA